MGPARGLQRVTCSLQCCVHYGVQHVWEAHSKLLHHQVYTCA
jgi:hypothetical protein